MSTAILISGQARTFAQCLPTQHWSVYRHFPDLHFFIVWQNTPEAVTGVKLLEDKYGADRVHAKLIEDATNLPMIPTKKGAHAPYANAAPHPQLLMQHWYQEQVYWWFLAEKNTDQIGCVIRMRGDNYFHSLDMEPISRAFGPNEVRDEAGERMGFAFFGPHVLSAWWGRFGGINDRFAVMNLAAAEPYFGLYKRIDELMAAGCPFHPESLLLASLEAAGVKSDDTLLAEFSNVRMNGQIRRFETEVSPADVANRACSTR